MGSENLGLGWGVLVFYGEGLHRWMGERCTVQIAPNGAIRVKPDSVVSLAKLTQISRSKFSAPNQICVAGFHSPWMGFASKSSKSPARPKTIITAPKLNMHSRFLFCQQQW